MGKSSDGNVNGAIHNSNVVAGKRGVAIGQNVVQSVIVTGDNNVVTVTYQGVPVAIPSPEAITAHRAALRERLQITACQRWGGMAVYIQEEGAALPIEASPYQTGRLASREKLLQALHTADRLLILGGPGSGKTVSLERLAWELCKASEPMVPVLVRLFRYDGSPLADWVRAYLQETGYLRLDDPKAVTAFLKESAARCFFLFDGLNEVQPDYRDALVGEIARWMASYPRHAVVLTSRPQDELWRRLRGAVDRALVVQPIGDDQARDYLTAHLNEQGMVLYDRLDERLREMARTPLILWLIKEAGAADESIPGNRGELYSRFVSRMLSRDTDRRINADIPERVKRQALTSLAHYLGQGQRLACPREEVVRVVGRQVGKGPSAAERVVESCMRHGLLSGENDIWFAPHQTVQEHFAALALQEMVEREWAMSRWERLRRDARRMLTGKEKGLAGLAANDWWMETFVQMAGLVDDTDRLIRDILVVNPWLALWCIGEGHLVSQQTQTLVEERSVSILHSDHITDRRRAVAVLAHIRNERVIDPLLWAAGDSDIEVSSLAVRALGELGKAVKPRAIAALENEDFWVGVLRCVIAYPDEEICAQLPPGALEEVLGLPMIWVPAGPFLMGSDKEKDPQASDNELPQHKVTLLGYWIGRYPVTVAQFRAFVEESGHRVNEISLKDPNDHPVRYVSWNDALGYCRWLSQRSGLPVMLPSEAEWEKAAATPLAGSSPWSGAQIQRYTYPWGDESSTADRGNFFGSVGSTSPVGKYSPLGDSPYGCADMAGNVWEWTRSLWGTGWCEPDFGYPYNPGDGRENLEAESDVLRVLRGGSFDRPVASARCACRDWNTPNTRSRRYGFRVVVSPFAQPGEGHYD